MRRRFVLVSLAVTAMVILVFAIPLALLVSSLAYSRAVGDAELQAAALASVLSATTEPDAVNNAIESMDAGRKRHMAVHLHDETHLGNGRGWASHDEIDEVRRKVQPNTLPTDGGVTHLRPAPLAKDKVAVIEVYVPNAELSRNVGTAWLVLAGLGLGMLLASALLADRLASGAVRATSRLAGAASRLGEGDLGVRVQPSGPPEIATVGQAFNTLADRFQVLLANERELVADLSHRLRTPLTALRLNAEAMPGGEPRQRVLTAAGNLEREVDAIITQARRPLSSRRPTRCELVDVVRERMRTWSALADDQSRRWTLDGPNHPVWVPVSESDLASALDALVGNVFRHTPEGTPYQVSIRPGRGSVVLSVDDGGPGIAEPESALRRGTSGGASTGLGTDIARRVAEEAGGGIDIGRSQLGGARVVLTFRTTDRDPPRTA
ncbi:MAG: sensor histidine kinase [Micromonosporaceae bacterium]